MSSGEPGGGLAHFNVLPDDVAAAVDARLGDVVGPNEFDLDEKAADEIDAGEEEREADEDEEATDAEDDEFDSSDGLTLSSKPARADRRDADIIADPVRAYLKAIGKVPLLDAPKEVELLRRIEAGLMAAAKVDADDVLRAELAKADEKPGRDATVKTALGDVALSTDNLLPDALRKELKFLVRDGRAAKDHMLEANLRLVVSMAKRYTGRGMAFLDLIQEGNLGLIRAVEKFDYRQGYKFSTYATWWIRQTINRAMADQARTIRIPVDMVEEINRMRRIQRELAQDLGREPTPEEIAKQLDIPSKKVVEMMRYSRDSREPISLNRSMGEEDDTELGELVEDSEANVAFDVVHFEMLQHALQDALQGLSEREAYVIRLRFGLIDGRPRTLNEIGQVYGLTRERIRQIESRTMSKLCHPSRSGKLEGYRDL